MNSSTAPIGKRKICQDCGAEFGVNQWQGGAKYCRDVDCIQARHYRTDMASKARLKARQAKASADNF